MQQKDRSESLGRYLQDISAMLSADGASSFKDRSNSSPHADSEPRLTSVFNAVEREISSTAGRSKNTSQRSSTDYIVLTNPASEEQALASPGLEKPALTSDSLSKLDDIWDGQDMNVEESDTAPDDELQERSIFLEPLPLPHSPEMVQALAYVGSQFG